MAFGGTIRYNTTNSGVQTAKTKLDLVMTKETKGVTQFKTTVKGGQTVNSRLNGNTGKMTRNERELALRGNDYNLLQAVFTLDGQPGDLTIEDLRKVSSLKGKMGITDASFNENSYVATIKYGDSVFTIDAESEIERNTRLEQEKAEKEAKANENKETSPTMKNPEKSDLENLFISLFKALGG